MKHTTQDDYTSRAVLHLRKGAETEGDERARHLLAVAEAVVDKRADTPVEPDDATSAPDWKGASYPYKQWRAGVYADAGIPRTDRKRFQNSLAYHVNNVLHERLGATQLASLELHAKSLRERRADQPSARIVRLVADTGPFENEKDATIAHRVTLALLTRMTDEQRAQVLRDALLEGMPHLSGRIRTIALSDDDEVPA